uniref:Nuclear receptor domain-containing protein n=1 Tax=Caenorhabditis tropicalis TaxID=1561998 RepID=A0A1I7T5J3_9PELO
MLPDIDQIDSPSSSNSSTPSPTQVSPGGKTKTHRKSGKPYQFVPSACQVCFGKATGHHYDVASCNGCKSFFRRVTIEKLVYKCGEKNNCYDGFKPGDSIPKCRACRYKRCVNAGMNPLGIQSELRKHSESTSIEETVITGKEVVVLPKITEPPKSIEAQVSDLIQHLMNLDLKTNSFRDCSYNPMVFPTLKEAVKDETSIIGFGDRFGPMPGWPLSPEVIEQARKPNPKPGSPKILPANVKRWLMYDLLTVVEMTKTFDFFRKLSEMDRYYLCRDTTLMVSNLTKAFFSVENKTDRIIRADGQTMGPPPAWIPKELIDKLVIDIMKRAISTLIRMKCTKIEFLLLRAILLCNSAAPDISNNARTLLSAERAKYTVALLNYSMANHGVEGPGRFAEILNVIDVLERQQKDQRDVNTYIFLYRPKHVKLPLLDDVMMTC